MVNYHSLYIKSADYWPVRTLSHIKLNILTKCSPKAITGYYSLPIYLIDLFFYFLYILLGQILVQNRWKRYRQFSKAPNPNYIFRTPILIIVLLYVWRYFEEKNPRNKQFTENTQNLNLKISEIFLDKELI